MRLLEYYKNVFDEYDLNIKKYKNILSTNDILNSEQKWLLNYLIETNTMMMCVFSNVINYIDKNNLDTEISLDAEEE